MSNDKQCKTCHWWFDFENPAGPNQCVLLNGTKGTPVQKVGFGGNKPLTTTADFGCNQWRQDDRKKG